MLAVRLEEPERFQYIDIPQPTSPGPGEALLKTHRMGICGTDVGGYLGKMPFYGYPRIPGHELGVEVLAVGEGVENVQVGDHCSVEPYLNCGKCYPCRNGATNCCETNQTLGVMCDGGLAEQFILRADKLHTSEKLSFEQLALVETLAIGCHACDRGNSQPGDHALVIGAGPIGLSALEFVRLTGAHVAVMDLVESRLNFCRTNYGIENLIRFESPEQALADTMAITGGDRFKVVIDATGNARSMVGAIDLVAHTGTLVYVGIAAGELPIPHPAMHKPEISIAASRNALPGDFRRIIGLIEDGTINTDPWITHRTPIDRMIEDFPKFIQPDAGVLKAIVELT